MGAASTAFSLGVPVEVIKRMGRWRSDALLRYIRPFPGLGFLGNYFFFLIGPTEVWIVGDSLVRWATHGMALQCRWLDLIAVCCMIYLGGSHVGRATELYVCPSGP